MPDETLIPLVIEKIVPETEGTKSFILSPQSRPVPYSAGQFLTFVFPKPGGEEDRRSYSLSSAPLLNERLQITVKRVANGAYSRWLTDRAKEGDVLYTTGATGYFVLPAEPLEYDHIVFFAAGSGITPVFALIKTLLEIYPSIHVRLLYSTLNAESTIFYNELKQLQHHHPATFRIDFLFSGFGDHRRERLNVARIQDIAHEYHSKTLFYLCGPLEYMRSIAIVLRTWGVGDNCIRKEIFHIEKPPVREMPPDALPHMVEAVIGDTSYRFEVEYPVTILQAAKKLNIPIPFSCEAGQCGTCSATCLSGNVWMWHNDVLLEDEIRKGRVLTCTGYPVESDAVLKF